MEYKEIVSVTGLGGLFQLLTTKSDGAIVRSIADNSTKFISARKHNITPLDSIEIYTVTNNVRLQEVLQQMKEKESKTAPVDAKGSDNDTVKGYFKEVYPDLDEDRVYVSDMKKILKWYQILKANDLLNFEEQAAEEQQPEETEAKAEEPKEEPKPKKKAATKKKAAAKKDDGEEKPAKKTATKKKAAAKKSTSAKSTAKKKED